MVALNGTGVNGSSMTVINTGWIVSPHHAPATVPCPWPQPNYLDGEQARLEGEIAAAKERAVAAKARASVRDAELREAMRLEFVAARESLAEMERQNAEAIEVIRSAAQADVEHILTEARRLAGVEDAD